MSRILCTACVLALRVGLLSSPELAAAAVVPSAFTSVAGNAVETTSTEAGGVRSQFVFDQSEFSINVGDQVTGLGLRLFDAAVSVMPQNVTNFDITLATAANAPDALSTTLDDNLGNDAVLVRSGAFSHGANFFPLGGSPNAFSPFIDFDTPFTYNGGPLLVEITHDGWDATEPLDAQFDFNSTTFGSAFGGSYQATTADIGVFPGFTAILQLDLEPNVIPTPAAALAIPALLAGLGLRRRRAA